MRRGGDKKQLTPKKTIILIVVGLLLLIVGVSYALYTYSGTGQTLNVIDTGQIKLEYLDAKEINIDNQYPVTDLDGISNTKEESQMTFKLKSTIKGNATIYYAIGLKEIEEDETLKDEYVRIQMTEGNNVLVGSTSTGEKISTFEAKYVKENESEMGSYALVTGSFNQSEEKTYTIKAWIGEDYELPNQEVTTTKDNDKITHNNNTNSEIFKFKIKVIASDKPYTIEEKGMLLKDVLLNDLVTAGDGLYKEEYTPSSELSSIYQSNLSNGNLTTYYYKGTNVNNYVSFAGLTWRVIRINEDGSIRLILNDGIDSNTKYTFNPDSLNEYAYMYYSNSDVANGIKSVVDSFYSSNLSSYAKYIKEAPFCEEAKVKNGSSWTSGSAEMVVKDSYTPSFDCKTDGNGKGILRLNIGLITIDEYLKSGGIFRSSQGTSNSYLAPDASANAYWTMSPAGLLASQGVRANAWSIRDSYSQQEVVVTGRTIRPVISLKTDTLVTSGNNGSSIEQAYEVITNVVIQGEP